MIDGISKTVNNKINEQRGGFLGMLLGTLRASMSWNIFTGKGVMRAGNRAIATSDWQGVVAGWTRSKKAKINIAPAMSQSVEFGSII